ncbi:MAG: BBP7 family outer membrane beta-barrel protein, partial [Pirellulaceae bacterium]|nr:BBP7 family outer membrane beta-barrel protein [Pirellulaceae bacterium]
NWDFGWLAGFRYFKFQEGFEFASDEADTTFTGHADELFWNVDVDNHLIGFQIGSNARYHWSDCFGLYAKTKMGVYGNHISHYSRIRGSNGFAFVNNAGTPNHLRQYNIRSTKNDVALMGELDLGMKYSFWRRFEARAGYRAVAVSGVALATGQFPQNFEDIDGVAEVQSNGSLILHGAYLGLDYTF